MLSRKSQVGDTLTWVVATLIIVVILIFFIYTSSLLAKTKGIERFAKGLFSFTKNLFSDEEEKGDWIDIKTFFAYEINSGNKEVIDKWIKENDEKS